MLLQVQKRLFKRNDLNFFRFIEYFYTHMNQKREYKSKGVAFLCHFFTKLASERSVLWVNPSEKEFSVIFESEASSVTSNRAVVAHESASVHLFPSSRNFAVPFACSWFAADKVVRVARVFDWSLNARWAEFADKEVGSVISFLEF